MSSNRRQQLYDRIRASSLDEVILEEMIRLGFWPEDESRPSLPRAHLARQGELTRELRELLAKQADLQDPQRALARMRKERLQDARRRRLETKRRRVETSFERRRAFHQRRKSDILHLGEAVSSGLDDRTEDPARLERFGLPSIPDAASLAGQMGITVAELRFLCFARQTSEVSHYQRFLIPKKTGGNRLISAPMPRLKRAQYWVLENILLAIPTHDAAHGFVASRSIVTNATPHARQNIVINFDLENFFPSITFVRVLGVFRGLGYSRHTATMLALLSTEPEVDEVELDGQRLFVARGERCLPQGAPTSPAISNLICRRLDHRLGGMARSLGFAYTRYADDLSFSAASGPSRLAGKLLARVKLVVEDEGFRLHPAKTRTMRKGSRQEVTGLVVNATPGIERSKLRRFRALLHQIERDGPAGKHWEGREENLYFSMLGFASFVHMVSPDRGREFLQRVRALRPRFEPFVAEPGTRYDVSRAPAGAPTFRAAAAAGQAPREPWWQPEEAPEPVLVMPESLRLPEEREAARASADTGKGSRRQAGSTDPTETDRPGDDLPRRSRIGFWWRLIEAIVRVFIVLVVFRVNPYLGIALALFFLYRWTTR